MEYAKIVKKLTKEAKELEVQIDAMVTENSQLLEDIDDLNAKIGPEQYVRKLSAEVDPLSGRPRLVLKQMLSKQPTTSTKRYKLPQDRMTSYSPKNTTELKGRFRQGKTSEISHELQESTDILNPRKGVLAANRYSNKSSGVAQSMDYKGSSRIGRGVNRSSMQPSESNLSGLSQSSVPGALAQSGSRSRLGAGADSIRKKPPSHRQPEDHGQTPTGLRKAPLPPAARQRNQRKQMTE